MDRFDAFISYSHAADGRLAPAVQAGLQRLAKKTFQRRALRVFRDETGLSTNPHLWGAIETALLASEWFVLLASPESSRSDWVDREVTTWLAHKPLDHLLVVVTDGTLAFTETGQIDTGRVDTHLTTCLPTALIDALDHEPRWLDLRWARDDTQLDLRNGRFRAAIADLAAPIHDIPKDDLESDDVHQQRRTRHLATTAIAAVTTLALVAATTAVIALQQRNEAAHQRDAALARSLAAEAVAAAPTNVDLALLLGVEGSRRDGSIDTDTGLLTALDAARHDIGFVTSLPDDIVDLEFDAARNTLYTIGVSGDLRAWDPETFEPSGDPLVTGVESTYLLDISGDGRRLAYSSADGAHVLDLETGRQIGEAIGPPNGYPTLDATGRSLATTEEGGSGATVWDVDTGTPTAEIDLGASLPAVFSVFLSDGRLAVAGFTDTVVHVFSLDDGAADETDTIEGVPPTGALGVTPDGRWLAAGGLTQTAALIEVSTMKVADAPLSTRGSRIGEFFSAPHATDTNGMTIGVAGDDGSLRFFVPIASNPDDASSRPSVFQVAEVAGLNAPMLGEFVSDRRLLGVTTAGQVVAVDLDRAVAIGTTSLVGPFVAQAARLDDRLVTAVGGTVRVSPLDDPTHPTQTADVMPETRAVAASSASGLVAVSGFEPTPDGAVGETTVEVLTLDGLEPVHEIVTGDARVTNVAFSPDGTKLVVAFRSGRLIVHDARTGGVIGEPVAESENDPLQLLVFTDDGGRLFAGGQDGVLRWYDTTTWQRSGELTLVPQQLALMFGQLAADRHTLLVPAESGELFLVDTRTGEQVGDTLRSGGANLQSAATTTDGRWIVAGGRDGRLFMWDADTHRPVRAAPHGHDAAAIGIVPLDDGRVMTAGFDGTLVTWDLGRDQWATRACELAGRNLTRAEWDTYVGGDYHRTCEQYPDGP